MRLMNKNSFLLLFLILFSTTSLWAQNINDKKWVPISNELIKYKISIFDVRANTNKKPKTDQNIGVVFRKGNIEAFLNTHKWQYNFTDGQQFKLSKVKPDAEGFRHPDFTLFGGSPFKLISYQKNALIDNVQVLIDADDYSFLIEQEYKAREAAAKLKEIDAIYKEATLLEKGGESQQKEAFDLFEQLAKVGDKRANSHLAMFYIEGKIVNKNITKAETLLLMADDNDIRAKYLLENIRKANDIPNWNVRHYGLVYPDILRIFIESGSNRAAEIEANMALEFMESLFQTEDVEVLNETLRFILTYESPYFYRDYYLFIKELTSISYLDHDETNKLKGSLYKSCLKLLKTGDCDWLWCYVTLCGDNYYKIENTNINLLDMSNVVWEALGVRNASQQQKFTKLIDKLCDIALKTVDKELLFKLYQRIWTTYDLGEFSHGYWHRSGNCFRFDSIVKDEEVLKKTNLVSKKIFEFGKD